MRKLGKKQEFLMFEAARRYLQFEQKTGKSLTEASTGLGLFSEYKTVLNAGLMTPKLWYTKADMWWRLTEKGAKIVQDIIDMYSLEEINKIMEGNN